MATIRTANAAQSRINMVIYGGHGAGKSTYALGAAHLKREDGKPFRILYIDNEMGSIDDYVNELENVDTRNIVIVYTTSLVETKDFIRKATAKEHFVDDEGNTILDADGQPFEADMIIVDGSSVLHKSALQARREFSKKRAGVRANKQEKSETGLSAAKKFVMIDGADIELKDYNTLNFEGQSLVLDLTGCGLHYIITAREKEVMDRKIVKQNGIEKEVSVSTGKYEPEGFKGLEYNAKTVARIWRDDDGVIKMKCSKDRTHTYAEGVEYEDPTILDFQNMIEKNKGKSKFAPANTMAEDIKREMEKVEREVLGTTINEAVGSPSVEEAPAPVKNEAAIMEALTAEYKEMIDSIKSNAPAKQALKEALAAKGITNVNPKGDDLKTLKLRLEVTKATLKK